MKLKVAPAVAGTAAAVVLVTSSSTPSATVPAAERALAYQAASGVVDYAFAPSTIAEALPSTHYHLSAQTGVGATISQLVVTGRFTGWRPGLAQVWSGGRDGGTKVAWDDPSAETRTVVLTFDVESIVAQDPAAAAGQQLRVWVPLDASAEPSAVASGLERAGRTIVFLEHPSNPAVADLWTISLSQTLLGTVADDGRITMGVLTQAGNSEPFATLGKDAQGLTVAELESASRVPRDIQLGG